MGIACRRWVTFHGLALNVTTDLAYFQRINPCGLESNIMSSLAAQLDRALEVADVRAALIDELGAVLRRVTQPRAAAPAA
jgi:lipoyl(octanoyl) transferase